nr:flavoprotein [Tissierella simiarum]
MVILTGGTSYSNEILEILMQYDNVKYEYIISENALKIEEIKEWRKIGEKIEGDKQIYESIKKAECVIIPLLTRNTLAKISVGIADNETTTAIQLALMMGKPAIAIDASWNPETEFAKLMRLNTNEAYNKMLFDHKSKAEKLGMSFVSVYDFEIEVNKYLYKGIKNKEIQEKDIKSTECSKEHTDVNIIDEKNIDSFITYGDISGKGTIYLSKNSRLTDLAKEYISQNRVKVIEV